MIFFFWQGEDLTLAASKHDIKVWVGKRVCNVTLVMSDQIACEPPPTQPAGQDANGKYDPKELPVVVVKNLV